MKFKKGDLVEFEPSWYPSHDIECLMVLHDFDGVGYEVYDQLIESTINYSLVDCKLITTIFREEE